MDATLKPLLQRVQVRGLDLSIRVWLGEKRAFLLVHGLASNARTWDGVGTTLNAAGHHVVAVDQRGHGQSDKPDDGYTFDEVTADLHALISVLGLRCPIVAGQSWGGNVVLDFAARHPEMLSGLVLVDGGFIELSSTSYGTWERIAVELKPPNLLGTPREQMLRRMRAFHEDWSDEGIEASLANFETLSDGTIRPWLSLDKHMKILRSLWEHKPSEIYDRVLAPTLVAVAQSGGKDHLERKRGEVAAAERGLPRARVRWFEDTAHDIHIHRPDALAAWMLASLDEFFDSATNNA